VKRVCYAGCENKDGAIEATRGVLCEKCYEGIRESLPEVPAILYHLRQVYAMQSKNELEGLRKSKKAAPAPLNLHALDLTLQIFWALFEHQPSSKWQPWEYLDIARAETWRLQQNLDLVVNSRRVASLLPLPKLLKTAKKSFPTREEKRATALPCPVCNKRTIYVPPQYEGDNLEVVCFDCGFKIPPEKMEFYALLAEREAENEQSNN
jgi:predicted RNA-binding Zn-ribbon protein involved in translation (DUF1610 family)